MFWIKKNFGCSIPQKDSFHKRFFLFSLPVFHLKKIKPISSIGLKKHFSLILILCAFISPIECFSEKNNNKYFVIGRTTSGSHEILKKLNLKSFQHPAFFTNKILKQTINSLTYLNYMDGFALWDKKKRSVFLEKETKMMAPFIRKGFGRASPSNMLYFSVGKKNQKTTGNIFYLNSNLYFYFHTIKGKTQKWDGAGAPHDVWKLIPGKGQAYLNQEGLLGLVNTYTDWLIIEDIFKEQTKSANPLHPEENNEIKNQEKIKNRLIFLKELLSEGIITKKDYEIKKQETLNGL